MGKMVSPRIGFNFESVVLQHPAFFEFCGTNKRIGAADLCKHVYRFWDMNTYELVFEIKGKGYQEIRVSDGVVVMLSQPRHNFIPLSLYDIEDGTLLATRHIEIVQHRELQFLELLATQLLIKQQSGPVRAYDIIRGDGFTVNDTTNFQPSGFVFYDTTPPSTYDESSIIVKSKWSYRPRKFFTISRSCIEFWELTRCHLVRTRQLIIQGMDNPDICCHSLWANLLFVRAYEEQGLTGDSLNNEIKGYDTESCLYLQRPKMIKNNDRIHTPTKGRHGYFEVDIFKSNDDAKNPHGILLFSLDGSQYYGCIDPDICGPNIKTLTLSNDLSVRRMYNIIPIMISQVIACGDDKGTVNILRMPNTLINNF
ncbi:hypothetical protein BaOVIS_022780 [Babesia ovis]|uniref:Uncharacterized protein n=1 Tax=Babesia ovis TaxID=5869 RepID=A0A9W5TB02_BABOV|nr:hypothetical protein BaOVIS_022780 [Babesia ovis]